MIFGIEIDFFNKDGKEFSLKQYTKMLQALYMDWEAQDKLTKYAKKLLLKAYKKRVKNDKDFDDYLNKIEI